MLKPSTTFRTLVARMRHWLAAEQGATAIEYALIASGLAVAVASTVFGLGTALKTGFYDKIAALF
jgi:pilus assembly protein Flp/PilA